MRKFRLTLAILFILAMGGGLLCVERQLQSRSSKQREHLRRTLEEVRRQTEALAVADAALETRVGEREEGLKQRRNKLLASIANQARALTNSFGPADGSPAWAEHEGVVWIEKEHLAKLGIEAVRDTDREETDSMELVPHLLLQISKQFIETHPEFGQISSLPPEQAAAAQEEYSKLVAKASMGLNSQEQEALQAALRQAKRSPIPGAMSQPPALYHLNADAATLLAMNPTERGAVDDALRDFVQRYQELERKYVSESDVHVEGIGNASPKVSFKVGPFPEAGAELKEEWGHRLKALVGEERAGLFLQMAASRIRSDFGDFGAAERSITFAGAGGGTQVADQSTLGHHESKGTSGPAEVPPGWRHLIVRPSAGGLPQLRVLNP